MSNIPTTAEIDTAIRAAIAALEEGWDWAQDFADAGGERHVIDGEEYIDTLPDETSREAAREYAEFVQSSYAGAQEAAEEAQKQIQIGDVQKALDQIREASRLERETGDDAAMAAPRKMIEKLDETIDDLEPDLTDVERAWNDEPEAEALPGSVIWGPHQPAANNSFTPRHALEQVLSGLPREFWRHALRRAGVSEELREHLDLG